MNLLVIGDIVSESGCNFLRKKLPTLKKSYNIDFSIANGENASVGNGILPSSADFLFQSGIDVITTGNHVFKRKEIYNYLDENKNILRPGNMHSTCPGTGVVTVDMGKYQIAVINLIGTAFSDKNYSNPFDKLDSVVRETVNAKIKIVDFHAEATGEKKALGFYSDGRVSAFFGTHTHVQTADACILPKGTGYITDVGMCAAEYSVLGVEPVNVIEALRTGLPSRFIPAAGSMILEGCIFEIDESTGKTISVKPIRIR